MKMLQHGGETFSYCSCAFSGEILPLTLSAASCLEIKLKHPIETNSDGNVLK